MKLRIMRVLAFVLLPMVWVGWYYAAVNVNTGRGQAPLIVNTAITADNESCYSFTSEIAGFLFHSRGNHDTKVAFTSGASGTTYITIPGGAVWTPDNVYFKNAEKVCFQNSAATDTIELVIWR